ncbi:MAG TPA: endonuclease, partial [Gammaproteobacteria bacterium]|nr:endonuclease [Gammaproteobacteria bacterium]
LLYAFERPVFVVDTYTRRIFERLHLLEADLGYVAVQRRFHDELGVDGAAVPLFNEYHALIVEHGKNRCRKRPLCEGCDLQRDCPSAGQL